LKRSLAALAVSTAAFAAFASSAFAGVVDYPSTATFSIPDATDNGGLPSQVFVPPGRTAVQKVELVNVKPSYPGGAGTGFELLLGSPSTPNRVSLMTSGCSTIPNTTSFGLSDSATISANGASCADLLNGPLKPITALSTFIGQPSGGVWTAGVRDLFIPAGGGNWNGWTLRLTHAAPTIAGTAVKQKLAKTLLLSVTPNANGNVTVGGDAVPGTAVAVTANKAATIPFTVTSKVKKKIKKKKKGTANVTVTLADETNGTATATIPVKLKK
jgi:hypothetical protein